LAADPAASVLGEIVLLRFEVSVADNLRARTVSTQINVLRRIIVAAIIASPWRRF
jgi:hypothetical protein